MTSLVSSIDGIPQPFLFFRFVENIVITVHDRFWNVGQANCILKYFDDVIGLMLRENCKSKQVTEFIA
jgi:hypothetical protein